MIDEARDIARQLHAPGSIEDKTQLLRRADELEHRVTNQRRGYQQALTAQLNALGVPSHFAGQPRAATVYDSLRMASWEIRKTAAIPTEVAIGTKALIDDPATPRSSGRGASSPSLRTRDTCTRGSRSPTMRPP